MPILPFLSSTPSIAPDVFIAPDAWVIGAVTIGERASLFFNVVVRGDIQPIAIGAGTNLQEYVLVHSSHDMTPVIIGENVTIGHRAIIHGCSIGTHSLIGMGATILDNAVIGEQCIIGAHTLITKGMIIPPRSLVMGSPGKVQRAVTDDEILGLQKSALHYQEYGASYRDLFPHQS
jgi:carbonic anhydrase/acetyltransferase-like protein (isoleucine patch superfamily)